MIRGTGFRSALVAAAALALLAGIAPVYADVKTAHGDPSSRFIQVNQVSDLPGVAAFTDPLVMNSWGLALGPTTPLWVSNNDTSVATVYAPGSGGLVQGEARAPVTIPGGAPTGTVFNDTDEFVVPGTGAPARFIFVSETGNVTAWNPAADDLAVTVAHTDGAVYKGVTILHTPSGPLLLAANFHDARIDVFNGQFQRVDLPGAFQDSSLPTGFAPFNILAVKNKVYITYALQDEDKMDDVPGPGFGFVDVFTNIGKNGRRLASNGTLNAPWGLAFAPKSFGQFAGTLLVGNFGDGRINIFRDGNFVDQLRDSNNNQITIDGLWALLPGTATTGGTGTVWFSAGPNEEADGLVGQLIPVSRR